MARVRMCDCPRCGGLGMVCNQGVDDMGCGECPVCDVVGEVPCADVPRGERSFTRYVVMPDDLPGGPERGEGEG